MTALLIVLIISLLGMGVLRLVDGPDLRSLLSRGEAAEVPEELDEPESPVDRAHFDMWETECRSSLVRRLAGRLGGRR